MVIGLVIPKRMITSHVITILYVVVFDTVMYISMFIIKHVSRKAPSKASGRLHSCECIIEETCFQNFLKILMLSFQNS